VAPDGKLASALNVAESQRLLIKFSVKSGSEAIKADQAFVRLTNSKADLEFVVVGEIDGDGYKVDLDVAKRANEFSRLSGTYELRIDIGDVGFSNAISALLGSVKLNFVSGVTELPDPLTRFQPKPEIKHLFREPEKRPAAVVSTAFSFAVLAPVLILLGLWAKLGINFKNFDFHPASLVFYASLGAIFYLYFNFWLFLDMFTTLKYLTLLGVVASLSGSVAYGRMYRRRTGKETKSE
jgi:oligosaccharyltransferase complex subunit delta (ribophorin II)